MSTLQASSIISSSNSLSSRRCPRGTTRCVISVPRLPKSPLSLPSLSTFSLPITRIEKQPNSPSGSPNSSRKDPMVKAKLYTIMESISDRIEMHKNIGEQRNNWNTLLLTSINAITLSAATMAGIASTSPNFGALKLSSTLMYLAATGFLIIMNKIQPSQLVEEQRNATRLYKNLETQVQRKLSFGNPTIRDVREMTERVLALDKAYPLPLLGTMLEKFPETVEPTVWWPKQGKGIGEGREREKGRERNGWSGKLEEEMRGVISVLEKKDEEDYLRLGKKALKLNKVLAISGPLLTGLAALGCAFSGYNSNSTWAAVLGVVAGAMASVVNTVEHGGQVGMVFEMYRSNAGFFKLMEETIGSNLEEREVERRENGELLELKVALKLGRSLSELRNLAVNEEFASKLF